MVPPETNGAEVVANAISILTRSSLAAIATNFQVKGGQAPAGQDA